MAARERRPSISPVYLCTCTSFQSFPSFAESSKHKQAHQRPQHRPCTASHPSYSYKSHIPSSSDLHKLLPLQLVRPLVLQPLPVSLHAANLLAVIIRHRIAHALATRIDTMLLDPVQELLLPLYPAASAIAPLNILNQSSPSSSSSSSPLPLNRQYLQSQSDPYTCS